jgi:hypothetical protein
MSRSLEVKMVSNMVVWAAPPVERCAVRIFFAFLVGIAAGNQGDMKEWRDGEGSDTGYACVYAAAVDAACGEDCGE